MSIQGLRDHNDEELMSLYLTGDQAAFSKLFARYERPVHSYLRHKLGKRELAEEVFQDCFMKLHRSRYLYDSKYPFKAFLFTIVRTVLIDHYRKAGRQQNISTEPLESTESALAEWPEEAMLYLAPREQTAIAGRYLDDKTFQELAIQLETSETNVRKIISRSLAKLKKILTGQQT